MGQGRGVDEPTPNAVKEKDGAFGHVVFRMSFFERVFHRVHVFKRVCFWRKVSE